MKDIKCGIIVYVCEIIFTLRRSLEIFNNLGTYFFVLVSVVSTVLSFFLFLWAVYVIIDAVLEH